MTAEGTIAGQARNEKTHTNNPTQESDMTKPKTNIAMRAMGISAGYSDGYPKGRVDMLADEDYNESFDATKLDSMDADYKAGYYEGYSLGYEAGYNDDDYDTTTTNERTTTMPKSNTKKVMNRAYLRDVLGDVIEAASELDMLHTAAVGTSVFIKPLADLKAAHAYLVASIENGKKLKSKGREHVLPAVVAAWKAFNKTKNAGLRADKHAAIEHSLHRCAQRLYADNGKTWALGKFV